MRRHVFKLLAQTAESRQSAIRWNPEQIERTTTTTLQFNRPLLGLLDYYKTNFSTSAFLRNKEDETAKATPEAADAEQPATEGPETTLSPEELQAALNEAKEALESERKTATEMREKLLRTLADMENLRERTARQISEARQFASADVVKSLLEVADNLERAAGSVAEHEVNGESELDLDRCLGLLKSLRDGVVMTDGILLKVLGKNGVTRYDPLGQPFDPNLHAALFQVPDATKEPGTVAVVIKKGYLMHERPLRAAEVGVAQSPTA